MIVKWEREELVKKESPSATYRSSEEGTGERTRHRQTGT